MGNRRWTTKEKTRLSAMIAIGMKTTDMSLHLNRTPHAIHLFMTKHPEVKSTAAMLELLDQELKKAQPTTEPEPAPPPIEVRQKRKYARRKVEKPTVVRKGLFGRILDAIRG